MTHCQWVTHQAILELEANQFQVPVIGKKRSPTTTRLPKFPARKASNHSGQQEREYWVAVGSGSVRLIPDAAILARANSKPNSKYGRAEANRDSIGD
jgi:hypothetical protein